MQESEEGGNQSFFWLVIQSSLTVSCREQVYPYVQHSVSTVHHIMYCVYLHKKARVQYFFLITFQLDLFISIFT